MLNRKERIVEMKKIVSLLIAASAAFPVQSAEPHIHEGSVVMSQGSSSRQVVITYDLWDASAIVTVDILTNGVTIGAANLTHFAGDVNCVVEPGAGRRITWRPDKAWPGHLITDGSVSAKVTAWALNAPPDYMVVDLVTDNDITFYTAAECLPFGGVTNMIYKTDKLVMRKCPAANVRWRMGAPTQEPGYASRQVAHNVTLTNDFYIGVYEMTQRQYERITGNASCAHFSNKDCYAARPMENLKWAHMRMGSDGNTHEGYDWPVNGHAVASDSVLGLLRAKVNQRVLFDLPLEAQWEFACRAGVGTGLYTGKEITKTEGICPNVDEIARYQYNSGVTTGTPDQGLGLEGGTAAVGSYLQNNWGIYDMCGNVMEYCLDLWKQNLTDVDPETGSLTAAGSRARRGGHFQSDPKQTRSAYRIEYGTVTLADCQSGFRLAAPAEIYE